MPYIQEVFMDTYSNYATTSLISPQQAHTWAHTTKDHCIIDMRDPQLYKISHAPHALSLPANEIETTKGSIHGKQIDRLALQRKLSLLGITPTTHIMIMDNMGSMFSCRLWWNLSLYGHKKISIIDGGWDYWQYLNLPTVSKTLFITPTQYEFLETIDDSRLAYLFDILSLDNNTILLDTRSQQEHVGEICYNGAAYAGSIPGSTFLPHSLFLNPSNQGFTFLEYNLLKDIVTQYNLFPNSPIITYCHSGTRASLVLFVLQELLGFTHVKDYLGSWIEYSTATKNTHPLV